jgi:lipoate---protein ligase
MKTVNYHTDKPEENIALDELFLVKAEKGEIGETLRFWESPEDFVVLGRSSKVNEECLIRECHNDSVKIIRRISGGGTVLQGKGCLNYSLVLSYFRDNKLKQVMFSYEKVLRDIARAFEKKGYHADFFPISDLAIGGRKFSGNAQARKKKYFLHHGSMLYGFEINKLSRYLKHPPKEPEYRKTRSHEEFVCNVQLSSDDLKELISEVFPQDGTYDLMSRELNDLADLVREKYSRDSWNLSF